MSDDLFWPRSDHPSGVSPYAQTEQLERDPASPWLPGPAAPAPRERPAWLVPAAAAGAAALVFGGAGIGIGAAIDGGNGGGSSAGFTVAPNSASNVAVNAKSFAGIAAHVLPSVVSINVRGSGQEDTGSGIILRADGYILTNNHVVSAASGGGSVSVVFNDGSSASARIIGTDQEDDLAVIRVNKTGLPAATLGNSAAVRVGDPVLAVGSPLGLTGTVTAGIVSSLNRPVDTTSDQQNIDPFGGTSGPTATTVISAIQTDAAINPGNSGGPLVDARGAVIGINSAIASTGDSFGAQPGNIGVGFAIPIDQAKVIAQELITTGHASHPLLGVSLSGDATDSNGNPIARVQAVSPGGPAATAGIQVGDVIVAIDGQPTAGADAVIAAIRTHQPGDKLTVTVLHNGVRKTVTVTLTDAASPQG